MIAVALDGTLLRGNSFGMFLRFVVRKAVARRNVAAFASIGWWSLLRRLKLATHRRLKWNLMRQADRVLSPDDYEEFARRLKERINPRVAEYIAGKEDVVLASAASAEYVGPFARLMGINDYIATARPRSGRLRDYAETRGTEKVRLLRKRFGTPAEVLTDHADDLPLLLAATSRRILVNPSATTLATVSLAGLDPEIWK